MILSVDPGVNGSGTAYWSNQQLMKSCYVDGQVEIELSEALTELIVELPVVYQQSKWKGDPNDLIDLAVVVGGIKSRAERVGARVTLYKPREWAKQVPKEIRWARAQKLLTAAEISKIAYPRAKSLHHNIHDAIGIGLFHFKRRGRHADGQ